MGEFAFTLSRLAMWHPHTPPFAETLGMPFDSAARYSIYRLRFVQAGVESDGKLELCAARNSAQHSQSTHHGGRYYLLFEVPNDVIGTALSALTRELETHALGNCRERDAISARGCTASSPQPHSSTARTTSTQCLPRPQPQQPLSPMKDCQWWPLGLPTTSCKSR